MLFILSQVKQLVYGGKDWKKLWSYKFLKSLSFPFYWCFFTCQGFGTTSRRQVIYNVIVKDHEATLWTRMPVNEIEDVVLTTR